MTEKGGSWWSFTRLRRRPTKAAAKGAAAKAAAPKVEVKVEGKAERAASEYVVLGWPAGETPIVGTQEAKTQEGAINALVQEPREGYVYAAVPARSWHPVQIETETRPIRRVKPVGAEQPAATEVH